MIFISQHFQRVACDFYHSTSFCVEPQVYNLCLGVLMFLISLPKTYTKLSYFVIPGIMIGFSGTLMIAYKFT